MFDSPFPPFVAFLLRQINDGDFASLPAEERALISEGAAEKRRMQFANGRVSARIVLRQLCGHESSPLLMGTRGEPLWPEGITGSITHCEQYAAVAAAKSRDALALGIDIERHDRELRHDIGRRICLPGELNWAQQKEEEQVLRTVTLFSAKESVFKALYHLTGESYRLRNMELAPAENGFVCALLAGAGALPAGCSFPVGCIHSATHVLTHVMLVR